MSRSLDDIKLRYIQSKSQAILLEKSGVLVDTCNTLFDVSPDESVYRQFVFLEGIQGALEEMHESQDLKFPLVEWTDQKELLLEIHFTGLSDGLIQCLILDRTPERDSVLEVQQQRNQSAINEEFLGIQKRYLEVEKELLDFKNEELQRIQEFKSMFFAEVSHEMRTPLNSMAGLIDLLQDRLNDESQQEYLENLRSTSDHLKAIINDVLDMSKAEAGKLRLEKAPFNLKKLAQATSFGLKLQADAKKLEFELNMDLISHPFLVGDEIRLGQIIYNLLGNAVKYTLKGKVIITLNELNVDNDQSEIQFIISDTGKGMSQQDIERILQPYGQAEGQSQREFEGTGLGMGIAVQLIELMGGVLSIQSQPQEGTTMSFTLVFTHSHEHSKQKEIPIPNLLGQKLLLVEDDVLSRNVLFELLHKTGAQIKMVDTVDDVLVMLAKHTFEWVISDINVVGGSTLPLFKEYKGQMILVSGDDTQEEFINTNYPMAHFLLKPVSSDKLYHVLIDSEEEADTNGFALDNLRRASQEDEALLRLMIETIAESLPMELGLLKEQTKNQDLAQIKHILHKIKPSIVYLGNQSLIDIRTELHDAVLVGDLSQEHMLSFIRKVEVGLEKFLELYR